MNRKDRLKVDEIEAKAKADPASITEEDRAFVMNYDIDQRRKRAVGARTKEAIFDMLGKGLRMYAGVPLGPGLREKREAREAGEREQAREYADQDTFEHRTAYGEKKAKFIDDIANRAATSLSAEDNEEIEKAKLEVQLAKDLRDFLAGPGSGAESDQDLAAQKAASRYLMAVSRGSASGDVMMQTMAGLETEYAIDRYAYWMNIYLGRSDANTVTAEEQHINRTNLTEGEITHGQEQAFPAGLTEGDREAIRQRLTSPEPSIVLEGDTSRTYSYIRQHKIDEDTLKPSPGRLSQEQRAAVASGITVEEATARATKALDKLESMPSIQDQIKAIAGQNLTSEQLKELGTKFTAGDVFDKVYGQTQGEAHALDTETESEVEWAMKRLQRTGNFDPLTSNEAFLADMKSKGLSPKDYAEFLRRNAQLKREREGTSPDKLERLSKQHFDDVEEARRLSTQTNLREPRGIAKWFSGSKSAKAADAGEGGIGDAGGGVPGAGLPVESSDDGDHLRRPAAVFKGAPIVAPPKGGVKIQEQKRLAEAAAVRKKLNEKVLAELNE